jgi:hypothetical protein
MLGNTVLLHSNIPSPKKNSSIERSSEVTPDPPPHYQKKSHLKMSVYFSITNTICKHWAKLIICSPSPVGSRGLIVLKDISTILSEIAISKF